MVSGGGGDTTVLMLMDHYCIAGINVSISWHTNVDNSILSTYKPFITGERRKADIAISFATSQREIQEKAIDFYIDPLFFRKAGDGITYFLPGIDGETVYATANASWDEIEIASGSPCSDPFSVLLLTDIAFRTRLTEFSGFSLHASVVEINGTAVLFTGPSGIGKSTQAELWGEILGASIINGDYGLIRQSGTAFNVYGSPWSGTSPYKTNTKAKVAAVILLEQSENNEIAQLTVPDATQGFVPNCLLPYWHQTSMDKAFNVIGVFLKTVPVYLLKCLPEPEAAELTYNTLFGNGGASL